VTSGPIMWPPSSSPYFASEISFTNPVESPSPNRQRPVPRQARIASAALASEPTG
jgi:hypothetical protein